MTNKKTRLRLIGSMVLILIGTLVPLGAMEDSGKIKYQHGLPLLINGQIDPVSQQTELTNACYFNAPIQVLHNLEPFTKIVNEAVINAQHYPVAAAYQAISKKFDKNLNKADFFRLNDVLNPTKSGPKKIPSLPDIKAYLTGTNLYSLDSQNDQEKVRKFSDEIATRILNALNKENYEAAQKYLQSGAGGNAFFDKYGFDILQFAKTYIEQFFGRNQLQNSWTEFTTILLDQLIKAVPALANVIQVEKKIEISKNDKPFVKMHEVKGAEFFVQLTIPDTLNAHQKLEDFIKNPPITKEGSYKIPTQDQAIEPAYKKIIYTSAPEVLIVKVNSVAWEKYLLAEGADGQPTNLPIVLAHLDFNDHRYELKGMVFSIVGHYFGIVKKEDKWYRCEDHTKIALLTEKQALEFACKSEVLAYQKKSIKNPTIPPILKPQETPKKPVIANPGVTTGPVKPAQSTKEEQEAQKKLLAERAEWQRLYNEEHDSSSSSITKPDQESKKPVIANPRVTTGPVKPAQSTNLLPPAFDMFTQALKELSERLR